MFIAVIGCWPSAAAFNTCIKTMFMETKKETYEAPVCSVVEMEAMQIVCSSATHEGFGENSYEW